MVPTINAVGGTVEQPHDVVGTTQAARIPSAIIEATWYRIIRWGTWLILAASCSW